MAITVGDAVLKLGVDTKDMDRGLKGLKGKIQKHSRGIGMAMTAMGGAILAAGALSVKTYAQMGDEVAKMALRTGFSTEALSELKHAAEISGASLGTLEKGVKKMAMSIADAKDGLATYTREFDKIGINVKELEGLKPEEQFLKIALAIAEVEDPLQRAASAQKIFGRAGAELLPLLAEGAEGINKLRREAHELGIVFDQEAANKAAEFNDAMHRMKESVSGVKMAIAENLIPVLMPLIDKIKTIISGISAWMKGHPELARVITLTTGAIGGLLLVLGPLLIFLPQITAAYSIMRGVMLTKLIPTIAAVTAALWAKVAALYAALWAMGPPGWGIAAASMILMSIGLVAIIKKARDATSQFTGKVDEYTPAAREADEATRQFTDEVDEYTPAAREARVTTGEFTDNIDEFTSAARDADEITRDWSASLLELEAVTGRISRVEGEISVTENLLGSIREKLAGQTGVVAKTVERLIEADRLWVEGGEWQLRTVEELDQAQQDYIKSLLEKEELTYEEIKYLEEVAEAQENYTEYLRDSIEADKERQEALKETNQLLKDQKRAQERATDTVKDAIRELQYQRSEAGKLNVSIADVIDTLLLMGRTEEDIITTLASLGEEQSDVLKVMDAFGLTAKKVADTLGMQTDEVLRLTKATEGLQKAQAATLDIIKGVGEVAFAGLPGREPMKAGIPTEAWLTPEALKGYIPGTTVTPAGELMVGVAEMMKGQMIGWGWFSRLQHLIKPEMLEEFRTWQRVMEMGLSPMQYGGIAMRPITARIAEKQPEAVIPLTKLERLIGGSRLVNIYVELDGRIIGRAIGQPLVDEIRLRTGVHI